MDILPILSTLRRHKITAALVVLEITLTCAIVCNAVFLISQRLERMQLVSGVAEHQLTVIQIASIGKQADAKARTQEDLALLRQIPGVQAAALTNQVPFTNNSWNSGIKLNPNQKLSTLNAATYYGDNVLQTLGTQLVAGRYFTADDYLDFDAAMKDPNVRPQTTIITHALAERLWPGQNPLGKNIYVYGDTPLRVIGVIKGLIRPSIINGDNTAQWSMAVPFNLTIADASSYLIRTTPSQRQQVLAAAAKILRKDDQNRIILSKHTLDEVRKEFFQNDRAMAGILAGVIIALLTVTALGIFGLASFWVAQRRHTIGVRRALGATHANILHYFQTENFLLTTLGILLGMLLAYGINLLLMQHYELPRLPLYYLPIGALVLWLLGQLAVLGPALHAAAVPPVEATRSV